MELIIVRHGKTLENVNRVCLGHMGGELSEEGILEARKLGERFRDKKIDSIYSSDLKRAVDTSKEVLAHHKGVPFILDERIRERFFGRLQGKPFPVNWDWENMPNYVESEQSISKRVRDFLGDIYPLKKNKTIFLLNL